MNLQIEKGIPVPMKGARTADGGGLLAVLRGMEVGDSVFIAGKKIQWGSAYVNKAQRGNEKEFTSRTLEGGFRIWRLK